MKALTTLATALLTVSTLYAQTDTTRIDSAGPKGLEQHRLEVGFSNSKGAYAEVKDPDQNEGDTLHISMGRKLYTIITTHDFERDTTETAADREKTLRRERRNQFTAWSGLDLGFNNYVGPDGSMDLDSASSYMQLRVAGSRFFAINFMEQKIEFGSHHVGLMTGLGLEFTSYKLENNYLLGYNKDSTYAVAMETPTYTKNKLRQIGLRMPLMFEFNTGRAEVVTNTCTTDKGSWNDQHIKRKNNFHIAAGVVGSVYFSTMYKQKYRFEGENRKDRNDGSYNLLPYRLAASVRFGWNSLNIFAEYGLTDLFKSDKGPELTPINVGITILGFD